jgi:hypothetical protein
VRLRFRDDGPVETCSKLDDTQFNLIVIGQPSARRAGIGDLFRPAIQMIP